MPTELNEVSSKSSLRTLRGGSNATIIALAKAGLPMVAEALSEDSLADTNPLYFQVDPQDRREAAMVTAFALQRLAQDGLDWGCAVS